MSTIMLFPLAVIFIALGAMCIYVAFGDEALSGTTIFVGLGLGLIVTGIEMFCSAPGFVYGITWLIAATIMFFMLGRLKMVREEGFSKRRVIVFLLLSTGACLWLCVLLFDLLRPIF